MLHAAATPFFVCVTPYLFVGTEAMPDVGQWGRAALRWEWCDKVREVLDITVLFSACRHSDGDVVSAAVEE